MPQATKAPGEAMTHRLAIMMTPADAARVREYALDKRMSGMGEAVRQIIFAAIDAHEKEARK